MKKKFSEKMLVLNTNVVKMLCNTRKDYPVTTSKFPPFILAERITGSQYVHALLFMSKNDRDKAYKILEEYSTNIELEQPFFYHGENFTQDMITRINNEKGNFSAWEGIA